MRNSLATSNSSLDQSTVREAVVLILSRVAMIRSTPLLLYVLLAMNAHQAPDITITSGES
jgi:hypothetical protein